MTTNYAWSRAKAIKNLTIDEDGRVDFDIVVYDGEKEPEAHYHTSKNGEGLWDGWDYTKQVEGLCDFQLKQSTRSGVYKAIKRRFWGE